MIIENLSTLKIHKLTQSQYDRELEAGNIDESALYLTPDEEIDLSNYVTIEQLNEKANVDHNHNDIYYTETEADALLSNKADTVHSHEISDINNLQTQLDGHIHDNYASTVTITGSGNAITGISQNGNTITAVKDKTFLTAHPVITISDDSTSASSPSYGESFTAIDNITKDTNGHITKVNTKTVTIPDTVATQSTSGLMSAADKTQLDDGGAAIVKTAGSGSAYTATVNGVTALTNGIRITVIPHTASTVTNPTLNVNSLGAKSIRMPVTYNTSTTSTGALAGWLVANKPLTLQYNGTYWITVDLPRPSAQYLYGSVPVANGGTGATTAEGALSNLGAAAADHTHDDYVTTSSLSPVTSQLESGDGTVYAHQYGKLVLCDIITDARSRNQTWSIILNSVPAYSQDIAASIHVTGTTQANALVMISRGSENATVTFNTNVNGSNIVTISFSYIAE